MRREEAGAGSETGAPGGGSVFAVEEGNGPSACFTLGMSRYFDPAVWQAVPFHFWSLVFFALGATVGSLLRTA